MGGPTLIFTFSGYVVYSIMIVFFVQVVDVATILLTLLYLFTFPSCGGSPLLERNNIYNARVSQVWCSGFVYLVFMKGDLI